MARRQDSTCRATNKAQNTGTVTNAATSATPGAPPGKALPASCPLPSTMIRAPLFCQAPPPSKRPVISAPTAR